MIEGGRLLAFPYRGPDMGWEANTALLDHMSAHPLWFAGGGDAESARIMAAWMLTHPEYMKWEIWNAGRFAGMLLLSRLVPRVDAVLHFTFLPASQSGVTLFGARRLLWNFIGHAFETYDLQRISVEVPEHAGQLAKFLRQRLAFRYEGEGNTERLQRNKIGVRLEVPGAPTWVAGQGSRREKAHWNGQDWSDLILLRLLRAEYETRASLGELPKATRDTPDTGLSDAVGTIDPRGSGPHLRTGEAGTV